MREKKQLRTVTYIRQMCCLGFDSRSVMAEILKSLHDLVPSHFNAFLWADKNYDVANILTEQSTGVFQSARLYLSEFCNKRECEVVPGFSETVRRFRGVVNFEKYLTKQFYRSDYYQYVLRPLNVGHILRIVPHENGIGRGRMDIFRALGERPYSRDEERMLSSVASYLSHALSGSGAVDEYGDTNVSGLVILNKENEIEFACPNAKILLLKAACPIIDMDVMRSGIEQLIRPPLKKIADRLRHLFAGQDIGQPPTTPHENAWGQFIFGAHFLSNESVDRDGFVGITIRYRQPAILTALANMNELSLSARQKDICLLLLQSRSRQKIAGHLGITTNTVTTHVRAIYDKLGVRNRDELGGKLRARNLSPDTSRSLI